MKLLGNLKKKYFISIKAKLIGFFILIVIIPVVVMALNSYYSSERLILNKYSDLLLEISKQTNVRIEEFLTDLEKVSLVWVYGVNSNPTAQDTADIQNFLKDSSDYNERKVYSALLNAITLKDRVYSIYVYNLAGGKNLYVSSNKPIDYAYNPTGEAWFKEFLTSKEAVTTINTHKDYQVRDDDQWVISSARKIYDMNNGELLGVIVFSVDIDFVDKVCGNILANRNFAFSIVDENNRILYNSQFENIGRNFTEIFPADFRNINGKSGGFITKNGNENFLVTYNAFSKLKWKTIFYVSLEEMSIEGELLRQNLVYIVLMLLLFAIASSYFISAMITRPVKKLIKNMARVEKGQFDNLSVIESNDEVGLLSKRFNMMSSELKVLVDRIYLEEKQKSEAEMNALQAQINPHFLYNTLNSIKWIAAMQKSEKIEQMIESLIFMLRYATRKVGDMVTIEEEIENIRNYITIQKVRYYNRLDVEYDIDENLKKNKVIKFTIQPIVENAIFHGLSACEREGLIKIQVARQENDVLIVVEDNGNGMDKETIEKINRNIINFKDKFNNIGISVVNSRLKMQFGEKYGVQFESETGKGTKFFILIPMLG